DLAHLHGGEICRHRHHRIEVPRRFAVGEIAPAIGAVGAAERDVALDRLLQHIELAIDLARLLALAEPGAGRGLDEEAADPRRAGAHALGERALRHDLELDPAGLVGGLEAMRVGGARKGADDLAHAAFPDETGEALIAGAGVVGDADEVLDPGLAQRIQELHRLADGTESRAEHSGAVPDAGNRLGERADALVDHQNFPGSPPLSDSIARASLGVATSSERFSRMLRMRRT